MNRNLRALGLALIAVFAMSPLVASARAETADFSASAANAHIIALPDGGLTLVNPIGKFTCVQVEESGPLDATAMLGEESSELTVEHVEYTHCHATIFKLPITVNMNGCFYQLTAGTMTSATTAVGTMHIRCPFGNEIEVSLYSNKANHTSGIPACVIHLPEQTPKSGVVEYHNVMTANGQKVVTVQVVKIRTQGTRTAGSLCMAGLEENLVEGSVIIEATENVDLEMTGTE